MSARTIRHVKKKLCGFESERSPETGVNVACGDSKAEPQAVRVSDGDVKHWASRKRAAAVSLSPHNYWVCIPPDCFISFLYWC